MSPQELASRINEALKNHSDKDWNYSRISLVTTMLQNVTAPYVLWCEFVPLGDDLKTVHDEVRWGERHASELGILELISLRINRALFESTSDDYWQNLRPVIRLVKKELLAEQGISEAFWYEVTEVAGEEFDSR